MLAKFAVDGVSFMRSAQKSNMNIVVEGANVRTPFYSLYSGINPSAGRATALATSCSHFLSPRKNLRHGAKRNHTDRRHLVKYQYSVALVTDAVALH
jgi:hypothetical protein